VHSDFPVMSSRCFTLLLVFSTVVCICCIVGSSWTSPCSSKILSLCFAPSIACSCFYRAITLSSIGVAWCLRFDLGSSGDGSFIYSILASSSITLSSKSVSVFFHASSCICRVFWCSICVFVLFLVCTSRFSLSSSIAFTRSASFRIAFSRLLF
jgi:hypothetical protein